MHKSLLIQRTRNFVRKRMKNEETSHDWFHIERVVNMSQYIAKEEEGIDVSLVELAALLHDIGDWKIRDRNKSEEEIVDSVTKELRFPDGLKEQVKHIILNLSYSNNLHEKKVLSREGQIVQDADRLDALGAIGIARAFAYGGKAGRQLYNPSIRPKQLISIRSYHRAKGTTVNHFYEKLFLLKNLLNTKTAKKIAQKRESFMKKFLEKFYNEWDRKV